MFAGGISDKQGNIYEAKCLVRQLFKVLFGEKDWVRFEGIVEEFEGWEFAVGHDEVIEWFQTKNSVPRGNWTIGALEREGVLKGIAKRLAADGQAHCCFISEDPAKDARILAGKARTANDLAEFEQALGEDQGHKFTDMAAAWKVDRETAWNWLLRCNFEVASETELDSSIDALSRISFQSSSGDQVYARLRAYMEGRFNKRITTEVLKQDLRSSPDLTFKDWSLDPTLHERLIQETEAYKCSDLRPVFSSILR